MRDTVREVTLNCGRLVLFAPPRPDAYTDPSPGGGRLPAAFIARDGNAHAIVTLTEMRSLLARHDCALVPGLTGQEDQFACILHEVLGHPGRLIDDALLYRHQNVPGVFVAEACLPRLADGPAFQYWVWVSDGPDIAEVIAVRLDLSDWTLIRTSLGRIAAGGPPGPSP